MQFTTRISSKMDHLSTY